VEKPWDLQMAEIVDGLCQRYNCLPSQIMNEDVGVLRMLDIVSQGKVEEDQSG